MPLVTTKQMLLKAKDRGYAVGAFNANNMESVKAVVEAAEEENAPVILQISQGAIQYAGLEMATAMVRAAAERTDIPVALHLDHGTDYEQNVRCLRAGFTSLMFDGSKLPYEDNVATTRKVTELCHIVGVPVEAELGQIGKVEDGLTDEQLRALMTDPDQAKEFVDLTECDSLAVAVGSVHGMTSRCAGLDCDRIRAISEKTDVPLVLHGSSGVSEDAVQEAIRCGVAKVNIATAVSMAFLRGTKARWDSDPDQKDFRKLTAGGMEEIRKLVKWYISILGCADRA
jgi:fructose-bisphosphate aldolase class II